MNATERPQTIQIFLPTGDPNGIRQAEITTRSVRVFDVPRSELNLFTETPESTQPGLYFLLSEENGDGEPEVYIGESDSLGDRLGNHDRKRTWDRVVAAVSTSSSWTKVHVQYMERQAIALAKAAGARQLGNAAAGYSSHVRAPLVADCEEYLETIRVLVSTLGFSFMEVPASREETADAQTLRISGTEAEAAGAYSAAGMTVFADSQAVPVRNPEKYPQIAARQGRLLAAGVLRAEGGLYVFVKDHAFQTPSGASDVIIGRNANGWTHWKSMDGRTLDEIYR
ncbi:GIY-YIG nuclease family protein [Microcella alkaliphila]|uniref:DUF4357 domain-containing protein n=1 Tax=Microcella alkaliphila TaxID=279828 RepID=A0A0U5B893_9MICO|nr:GIY-YIG nuclease family protein [Microcella alkaliphila]BAU32064.1 uncharacterized protein MalAC0309_1207 [Microcella alkaliphila]